MAATQEAPAFGEPLDSESLEQGQTLVQSHAFLQTMMNRSYMRHQDAKKFYLNLTNGQSDGDFNSFVSEINYNISTMGFELRTVKDFNDVLYIGFVNKEADESSKKATGYRTKDGKPDVYYAAFFRAVLEKIALCEEPDMGGIGYITSQDAYYVPLTLPDASQDGSQQAQDTSSFKMGDRQKAIQDFVEDGWLSMHPLVDNVYCLGPRAILELGTTVLDMPMNEAAKARLRRAMGYGGR